VTVKAYQKDNGVYKSNEFMRELAANTQSIRFSGKMRNGKMAQLKMPSKS